MTLTDVVEKVHTKCLSFRSLDRIVTSEAFAEALRLDPNNIWVQFALINGDAESIENWIDATLQKDIGEMSLRELRTLASKLGIPCYTSYNKDTLLIKIAQVNYDRRTQEVAC
jgi:hypothetical protein